MSPIIPRLAVASIAVLAAACGRMEQSARARPGDGAVIYQATILTMDPRRPAAGAVVVKDGFVLDLGAIDDLVQAYSGASFDERFLRKTVMPAFVDVRLRPNALNILEAPCEGDMLTEDILSMGAGGATVRIVANGRTAFASAVAAVRSLPDDGETGRVSIELRGPADPEEAKSLIASGVPLILSGEPAPADCEAGVAAEAAVGAPTIAGRVAIAAVGVDDHYLAAAAAYVEEGGTVRLSPREALEAVTIDAAYALGAEAERGVIAPGRRADFAILDRNPLATPAAAWRAIEVESFAAGEPLKTAS